MNKQIVILNKNIQKNIMKNTKQILLNLFSIIYFDHFLLNDMKFEKHLLRLAKSFIE
jgi:hypothetical protein